MSAECINPTSHTVNTDNTKKSESVPLKLALYAGGMYEKGAEPFLAWASTSYASRCHCLVLLATTGGSAGMAYRISRALQRNFSNICIAIPWICKSAGTLLCLGASSLMFGENGELGPLDVQIPQKDELVGFSSGLTPLHALSVLQQQSFNYFEEAFLSIIRKSGGQISTTKAARIAIRLTVGLFGQIYQQIDPLQLGKTTRDMNIAQVYGERLSAVSQNLKPGALERLLIDYPEHGFVIDGKEAEELFKNVLPMPPEINDLSAHFLQDMKQAIIDEKPIFQTFDIASLSNVVGEKDENQCSNIGENHEQHDEA